jgi:hypothetical protein
MTEIGVRVLNEGTGVWGKVPAQHVAGNVYCIIDNSFEEENHSASGPSA